MATVYNPSITLAQFDSDIQANGGVPSLGSAVLTAVNEFLFHSADDAAAVTGYYDDSTNSGTVTLPIAGQPVANLLFGPGAGPNTGVSGPTNQTISASGAVIVLGPGVNTITDPGGNWIFGGSGNNTINVGSGDDSVVAGSGPTFISTAAGVISSGTDEYWAGGKSTIYGGNGSAPESIYGGLVPGAADTLWGGYTTGNEFISVTQGNNWVQAGFGNATVWGGSGNDTLRSGNPGSSGAFATSLVAGTGNQLLQGGRFANAHDTLVGGSGNDTLEVTAGADVVRGGSGGTWIFGGTGANTLIGGGNSTVYGGSGSSAETLLGGLVAGAHDSLWGGYTTGNEIISVTQGNNWVQAGFGNATVYGGSGDDTLRSGNPNGSDDFATSLVAGSGNQELVAGRFSNSHDTLVAGSGNDTMYTSGGNNSIVGGSGNDTLNFNSGGGLNDTVSGSSGNVLVNVSGDESFTGLTVNQPAGSVTLNFTENGSTQTLTYTGAHVGIHFNS